ncbi:hypothetical protein PYCC9005_001736 [Savitreella phatthalungensis]
MTAPPAYPFIELLPELRNKRVVLCSGSPRRKALLSQAGIRADVIVSDFKEDLAKDGLTPWEYALQTATAKVLAVYKRLCESDNGPDLLIAADTVVFCGNTILEKPASPSDHLEMLKRLREASRSSIAPAGARSSSAAPGVLGGNTLLTGQGHRVITAVAVLRPDDDMPVAPGYILKTAVADTLVHFDAQITDETLANYVRTGEGTDKAGGYAIQGQAAAFVTGIDGGYDNVVGLPLNVTVRLIKRVLGHDVYAEENQEEEVML